MTNIQHDTHFSPGSVLEWTPEIRESENFSKYTALIGKGPFSSYEMTYISPKPPVYGDERFRDGMRVPEKQLDDDMRLNEARQIGDTQRVKIHAIDSHGHHVSAEFPAYFFQVATRLA
jgi:hypothetical protein